MQHAYLALSLAPVWGQCSLAPSMAAAFPNQDTIESREGTAVHWWCEQSLLGHTPGPQAPNGVILTDEMREAGSLYVLDVQQAVSKYQAIGPTVWGVERHVKAARIHPEHCAGTVDAFLYCATARTLITWNYKHGHKEVNEFEDLQEVGYVSGLLDHLNIDGHAEQSLQVQIRIVQPRCYTARGPVRTWHIMAPNLRPLWNRLAHQAEQATTHPVGTSGAHCFYCAGRHACEAARNAAMSALDYVGGSIPEPLTAAAVSFELAILQRGMDAIEARWTGLQEQAKGMIKQGVRVPGWGLEGTKGRLAWKSNASPATLRSLAAMYGVSLEKPDQFITPTQAKKAGIDEAVINVYADSPSTGVKLVKQDSAAIARIVSTRASTLPLKE